MEEEIEKLEAPEVCVKKAVMQKINDEKIKIKHPTVLLAQKTGAQCVRIIFLAAVVTAGVFFARWVAGKF